MSENNVHQINQQEEEEEFGNLPPAERAALESARSSGTPVIQLSEEDCRFAQEAYGEIANLHIMLGEERERTRLLELEMLNRLQEKRKDYESTMQMLSKKYVSKDEPGQYSFLPTIGAFIKSTNPPAVTPLQGTSSKGESK